jgi:hypothetical protein
MEISDKEALFKMLKKCSGNSLIQGNQDIERDLGLTGDDAYDLIEDYGKVFNVDVSKFSFKEYFYDEGEQIIRMFHGLIGRYKRKIFTVNDLLDGIEKGFLE